MRTPPSEAILYFDGSCMLCNRLVQFVLKNERTHYIKFATLQSELGLRAQQQLPKTVDSVIFYYRNKYHTHSTAGIWLLYAMGGLWKLAVVLFVIPGFLRNAIYSMVAKNRYRWFGKTEMCFPLKKEWKERMVG